MVARTLVAAVLIAIGMTSPATAKPIDREMARIMAGESMWLNLDPAAHHLDSDGFARRVKCAGRTSENTYPCRYNFTLGTWRIKGRLTVKDRLDESDNVASGRVSVRGFKKKNGRKIRFRFSDSIKVGSMGEI